MVLKKLAQEDYQKIKAHSFEQVKEQKNLQRVFVDYLKWLSVYGLAYEIANQIDNLCRDWAKAEKSNDEDRIESAKRALTEEMSFVVKITESLDLINDIATGFSKLEDIINAAPFKIDFLVLIEGRWWYSDLRWIIKNSGFLNEASVAAAHLPNVEALWDSFVKNSDPTGSNINGLMEKPEDEELVRIY